VGGRAGLCHPQQHGEQQRWEDAAVHDGRVLLAIRFKEKAWVAQSGPCNAWRYSSMSVLLMQLGSQ
jgi:hypothetical protein